MKSVVVVPPATARGIDRNFRIWAEQYRGADSRNRYVVELGATTPEAVVAATRTAIGLAGRAGQIIYAGHGGVADGSTTMGVANLAPEGAFRITGFVA